MMTTATTMVAVVMGAIPAARDARGRDYKEPLWGPSTWTARLRRGLFLVARTETLDFAFGARVDDLAAEGSALDGVGPARDGELPASGASHVAGRGLGTR